MEPRTVLVVDDDDLVREAFRSFFSNRADLALAGEARDGAQAVEQFRRLRPDVVLMDLQMPVMNGVEATTAITHEHPDACVVVLTTFGTRQHIIPALRAGAAGYLLKDAGSDTLVNGLYQAMAGDMPLSASVRRELVHELAEDAPPAHGSVPEMTPREVELLGWLAHGLSNTQIASRMYVSESSVKQYMAATGQKLGATSRTQVLMRAIQCGLVDPHHLPPLG